MFWSTKTSGEVKKQPINLIQKIVWLSILCGQNQII